MSDAYALVTLRRRDARAARSPRPLLLASLTLGHAGSAPALPPPAAPPRLLPAWERAAGGARGRQYAWDGRRVALVDPESFAASLQRRPDPLGASFGSLRAALSPRALAREAARQRRRCVAAFFPDAASVTCDYWPYARFRFLQRAAAQALAVLATQNMLLAVGLGASRALPAAAALNWVLKDGLGRVGKLAVATRFGRTFDSDVKRARFASSCAYDMAALVEMATPWAPRHFLALATAANICKSMGITVAVAVRAPIQRSFALEENLADINARTAAQQVLADNLGLAAAVACSAAARRLAPAAHPGALPLALFAPLACADMWAVHCELKSVALRTLNTERCAICAAAFVRSGEAPSPAAVAVQERLVLPPALDGGPLPLRVGPLGAAAAACAAQAPPDRAGDALTELLAAPSARRDRYVLAYVPAAPRRRAWGRRPAAVTRGTALLALQAGASSAEALQALLQVAHLRQLPYRGDLAPEEARRWALAESYRRARRDRAPFLRALKTQKWQTQHLLLSANERAPYLLAT